MARSFVLGEPFTKDDRLWHLTSNPLSSDCLETEFIQKVQHRLQRSNLPITIGPTGYIHLTGSVENFPNRCWTTDSHGRIVIKWDNKMMFQRSQGHAIIMYGIINKDDPTMTTLSNQLSRSELTTMIEFL